MAGFSAEEMPTLWAVAGGTRQAGRTTVTASLGGLLALKGYAVELIRPDFFFNPAQREQRQRPMTAEEMQPVFERLHKEYFACLCFIQEKLVARAPQQLARERQQIFLDLNASLSHHTLDLFLAADIRLVVIDPAEKSLRELDIFLNACFLRWLELTLQEHDDSLHDLFTSLQQRRKLQDVTHLDFFDAKKVRQAISPIAIHVILNKTQDDRDFQGAWLIKSKQGLYSGTNYLGSLFFDKQSVHLISVIDMFFNHLFHHDRLDLFKCIEYKMINVRRASGSSRPANLPMMEPLNTWPYSVVDGQIVLNLNPTDFDTSTTDSDFSALDSDLFE